MKILDLKGSAYERGVKQGKEMREDYINMLNEFFSSEMWKENKPGGLPDSVIKLAMRILGVSMTKKSVKTAAPAQLDRVEGLAEGLGINRAFCWGLQFMEILFCEAGKSLAAPEMGCTQLHATPASTADGKPLLARNYDFPNMLKPYQLVRRDTPSEAGRLATISLTQAPLAGTHQGMNEAGLAIAANNARLWKGPDFRYKGVPYMLIMMELLETCRTVAEAADKMINFPARANTGFFGMMDESGDCCVVEFTSSRAAVRRPDERGVIAQTNHYLNMKDANLPDGTYWTVKGMEGLEYAESTLKRYEAAYRLMSENAGKITVDTLKSILRDHSAGNGSGTDCTVCCHGLTGGTLASTIFDIKERTAWVADGHPCESEYVRIPLKG
ncbi:MAG TPA: C45 family autoproteolytic acyltransferase/hydrolase [bacterium]|nr:C45 family autoproteolytic acyltransferase/hydrolase [bacterium]